MAEQATRTEPQPDAPVDRKRIALLNGSCGQSDRIAVCGQIVDIPITAIQKRGDWDLFTHLPVESSVKIRPMQDMSMSGVRRPRLQLELLSALPEGQLDLNTLDSIEPVWRSETFNANDDSFFSVGVKSDLPPGDYYVRIMFRGVDSLRQSVADLAFIGNSDSLILKKDLPIGYCRIRILPFDYTGYILTSDIDQTFLDTQIASTQGLVETLFETPDVKRPLPGMVEFYRQIQKQNDHIPFFFISASPHFFRRTLHAVFDHHQIGIHGLNLKYLLSTIDSIFKKLLESVSNIEEFLSRGLSHAVDRTVKFLGSSFVSLFDQVAYKLIVLLENRRMQPTGAREILMGDNTEGDYFIFILYQFLLLGRLTGDELENYLYHLNFQNREALTRDAARRVRKLVEENVAIHGHVNPVKEVWINLAYAEPDETRMAEIVNSSLPEGLVVEDPSIVRIRACQGGAGFAFAALDAGLIDLDRFREVIKSIVGQTLRSETVTVDTLAKYASEFPFRSVPSENVLAVIRSAA